jgi:hypothetical protein
VTEKVLTAQLRELETGGIVHREVFEEVPPRVEYSLTPLGASLNEALAPLGAWGASTSSALLTTPTTTSITAPVLRRGTLTASTSPGAAARPRGRSRGAA